VKTSTWRWKRAYAGTLPGEALSQAEGDRLIAALLADGFTPVDVAEHTGWSTYTVHRKLARMTAEAIARRVAAA
jgi:hypothetical protein